ncbi:MAG: hypothetical protein DUD27_04415 [Lachnospiraceae bacterium]|uniref:Uncharacterized protein n=1 Tax=Candidatus Weimeria bifida TaxID=2599074 RepID=A0A6N7IZR3_9FIRM|nr:hypothetical protein [Candidatus Weimeria bifida]RRF96582.1 MAG: hypothetical protein DUD27_04415 [Lachnospiraceae bacterium]
MDWVGVITSFICLIGGVLIYLAIMHTKWGKSHTKYQVFIMILAIVIACVAGGLIRFFIFK